MISRIRMAPASRLIMAALGVLSVAGCTSLGKAGSAAGVSSAAAPSMSAATPGGSAATTPAAALEVWLADLIDNRFRSACMEMAMPTSTSPTVPMAAPSSGTCADLNKPMPAAQGQTVQEFLQRLNTAFAPAANASRNQLRGLVTCGVVC
jgi:hypothetical protein